MLKLKGWSSRVLVKTQQMTNFVEFVVRRTYRMNEIFEITDNFFTTLPLTSLRTLKYHDVDQQRTLENTQLNFIEPSSRKSTTAEQLNKHSRMSFLLLDSHFDADSYSNFRNLEIINTMLRRERKDDNLHDHDIVISK